MGRKKGKWSFTPYFSILHHSVVSVFQGQKSPLKFKGNLRVWLGGPCTSPLLSSDDPFVVQSPSHDWLSVTPLTAARQVSLSITNSWSLLRLMSVELVVLSNHLILCRLLLLPPSIFPSMRVFFNESVLCIRWPKCWSFSFSISPSNEYSGLISFRRDF